MAVILANTAGLLEQKYAGFYGDDPAHFAAVSKSNTTVENPPSPFFPCSNPPKVNTQAQTHMKMGKA